MAIMTPSLAKVSFWWRKGRNLHKKKKKVALGVQGMDATLKH